MLSRFALLSLFKSILMYSGIMTFQVSPRERKDSEIRYVFPVSCSACLYA